MADNVGYTPGEGAQIAADEIGGVLHQRAKVQFGDDGTAIDVSESNPLPVAVSGVSTEATLAALKASLDALSAKVAALDGGRMPVVLPAGSSGLTNTELRDSPVKIADETAQNLLWRMLDVLMSPSGYDSTMQRQRVTAALESGTVTTVTTVGTITNLSQIDGRNGAMPVQALDDLAWYDCVRARIS